MSIIKHATTVGGLTLLSRIAGFIRDMFVAAILGTGFLADAYVVAFRLPNLFRRLFAEGAFNAAFIPLFSKELVGNGKERAQQVAESIFSFMLGVLLIFTLAIELIMPWFMVVMAPGFMKHPQTFELAIVLTRITFPYLMFISLVALLTGILNSLHRFTAGAFAPVLLNVCMVIAIIVLTPFTPTAAHALAIGIFVAGLVQFAYLFWCMKKANFSLKIRWPHITPEVSLLLKRMIPGIIGSGVGQINVTVDQLIATLIPSAVSFLYYADRLHQFPLAIIGTAVGTALLPMLAQSIRLGDHQNTQDIQNRSLELAILLTLPAAAALFVISDWIIGGIYERGAFTHMDTINTSHALIAFAVGLPAMVMVKVLTPGFFARDDTSSPIKIACICIVLNIVFNLMLTPFLKHVGIALATSISAWCNAGMLAWKLHKRNFLVFDQQLKTRTLRIIFSTGLMVASLILTNMALFHLRLHMTIPKEVGLVTLCGIGGITFLVSVILFKGVVLSEFKTAFSRKSIQASTGQAQSDNTQMV
ncbi:MAG: murein biosynthesis integral membrane protein MurJ [Alphaproteobacteria bacterium]|nr:murein biosynthesis integral membrane protein MurJ [Alphaproteobacteria bacterium]